MTEIANVEAFTGVSDDHIGALSLTTKNFLQAMDIFQQGTDRQSVTISLMGKKPDSVTIHQRTTTPQEEVDLVPHRQDKDRLASAGSLSSITATLKGERPASKEFDIGVNVITDDKVVTGNMQRIVKRHFNLFSLQMIDIIRQSNVLLILEHEHIDSLSVAVFNEHIDISMIAGTTLITASVSLTTKTVSMTASDDPMQTMTDPMSAKSQSLIAMTEATASGNSDNADFSLGSAMHPLQKAVEILATIYSMALKDTGFFINTIGTKNMIDMRAKTAPQYGNYGYQVGGKFKALTVDDLIDTKGADINRNSITKVSSKHDNTAINAQRLDMARQRAVSDFKAGRMGFANTPERHS